MRMALGTAASVPALVAQSARMVACAASAVLTSGIGPIRFWAAILPVSAQSPGKLSRKVVYLQRRVRLAIL